MSRFWSVVQIIPFILVGTQALARADEPTEVTALDSAIVDKSGRFKFSYTAPGGCEKHTPKVQVELKLSEAGGPGKTVQGAKIHVLDQISRPDPCAQAGVVRMEGSTNLQEQLQREADAQNAIIEDRRVPITLPDVSVFTGKQSD